MTKFLRVLIAIIGIAGVVAATNVGIINPLGDLLIVVSIAVMTIMYLRKAAKLGYVVASLVVMLAAILTSMIYQNVPSTLYKSGLIVLGMSALIIVGDFLMYWLGRARTSVKHS